MSGHLLQAGVALAVVFAFLMWAPAPEGCGCAKRKRWMVSNLAVS